MQHSRTKPRSKQSSKPTSPTDKLTRPLEQIAEELQLAVRLERPMIYLVVASSAEALAHAQKRLAQTLRKDSFQIKSFKASTVAGKDVPNAVLRYPRRKRTVFFVQDLKGGGSTAFLALNYRREYFIERAARVVFWLLPAEEAALARQAPDFWAFRHRVMFLPNP